MPSWADDVPEPAAQQSGSRRGPAAAAGEAPRRSVLDRLGPAAAPASSTGVPAPRPAPRPHPQPPPREGKGRSGSGTEAPDLGPEVDWRLSRISLDDDDGPRRRARGLPEARGRRVVTVTPESAAPDLAVPARLAGRIVLPSAQPQVASPPSRRKSPPPLPREVAAAAAPSAKAGASAPPFVVHVGPRGDRVVQRAAASPPVPKPAAPKPAPRAGAVPRLAALWNFRDKRGAVQGPHSAGELVAWYAAGYYGADLPVQRVGEAWTTLREALPELKASTASAAPKAAPSAAAKAVASAPSLREEPAVAPSTSGAQGEAADGAAAVASAASVWSTEETLAAKRMFGARCVARNAQRRCGMSDCSPVSRVDRQARHAVDVYRPVGRASGAIRRPRHGHVVPGASCIAAAVKAGFVTSGADCLPQGGYMEDRELMVANATTREPGVAEFSPLAALLKPADAS